MSSEFQQRNTISIDDNNNIKIIIKYFQPISLNYSSTQPCSVSNNTTGFKHFLLGYGFKNASSILNSINEYPSGNMMQLLYSFHHEFKTSKRKHRKLLRAEIKKLEKQISNKQNEYKEKLAEIFLQRQVASEVSVKEIESWSFHELIEAISHLDDFKEGFFRETKQFDRATEYQIKKYKIIRLKREKLWNYARKLVEKICNPTENEFNTTVFYPGIDDNDTSSALDDVKNTCVVCDNVLKYVVLDCGHCCLCKICKTHFEGIGKKCPLCRRAITKLKMVNIKPTPIGNRCARIHCSNEREYMVANCGHYCLCEHCKVQAGKCPVCKRAVTKVVRIFVH